MEALKVQEISRDFGGVRALVDVSLQVEVGERLAIIGPNGAGKTTLFNVLNGQIPPSSGQVFLFQQDITHMATERRAVLGLGRSFQVTSLFSSLTVLRNVLLALNGTSRRRFQMLRPMLRYADAFAQAEALLGAWDLLDQRDELVRNLAYGSQRKLEIAVTLASMPRVLLLDEPSTGLTSAESAEMSRKIHALGSEITVILVAHDMDLVFGVAERILVMHQGRVLTEGSVEQIRADSRVREIYMGFQENDDDSPMP